MRRIYFLVLITSVLLVYSPGVTAQVSVSINIGSQPVWGPVGYDVVEYYYLPDIETYYYVPGHRFYYYENGIWVNNSSLPSRYAHYDIYKSYKVVINENEPWRHHDVYVTRYAKFKGRHDQTIIRESHDSKYFVIRDHPEHSKWNDMQKKDKGNGHNNKRGKNDKGKGKR